MEYEFIPTVNSLTTVYPWILDTVVLCILLTPFRISFERCIFDIGSKKTDFSRL